MRVNFTLGLALFSASILAFHTPLLAATVGAEYANQDTNGDPYLPNTGSNASGFVSTMAAFGHSAKFLNGNSGFWTGDPVAPPISGAWNPEFADSVNIYFFSTHGGSNSSAFYMSPGYDNTVDGVTSHTSYTSLNGHNWWRLGLNSNRILSMVSCHSLELSNLGHWDSVANGMHMLTGGSGLMYDNPGRGSGFAFWGNWGMTVKQAWFMVGGGGEMPVVMAYGVNSSDAYNRRDNEKFNWSMAPLGYRTYRAWSWVSY